MFFCGDTANILKGKQKYNAKLMVALRFGLLFHKVYFIKTQISALLSGTDAYKTYFFSIFFLA